MPSNRPSRYITPEEWKSMSLKEREASTKAADDIAREEVEKEERAAKKKSKKDKDKKKEKDGKKDKKKKKEKKKDVEDDDDYVGSGCEDLEDMLEAVARSEAEARASSSKDKATPAKLMVKIHPMNPMHILKSGWNGRSL